MKGSKSCPNCETSVGPRTKTCPKCAFEFIFKNKTNHVPTVALSRIEHIQKPEHHEPIPQGTGKGSHLILVPAGRCPVSYHGNWTEWVHKLKEHAKTQGVNYSVGVFTYWAHMEGWADKFTDDGKKQLKQIEELATQE